MINKKIKTMLQAQRSLTALILGLVLVFAGLPVLGKMVFQIKPVATISEEYSDNYLRQDTGRQEEFITSYAAGLSMSLEDPNTQVYLSYTPTYRDYKNLDERDGVDHVVTLDARFRPSRSTELAARVYWDGKTNDYQGDRRERSASLSGKTEAGKHTDLAYSHAYSRRFEQQLRTGVYKGHTVNTTRADLSHEYGKKDVIRAVFIYELDEYKTADPDGYKKVDPSVTGSHWFSQAYGMEANLGYLNKDFDQDSDDLETWSGYVKFLHAFSKHLDGFVRYRHSYSETPAYTHHIFHPSVGVDWEVSEDSGISLGLGVLAHDRSDGFNNGTTPFIDLDAFKRFEVSPRTSLTFTGSSEYSSSGDSAASLGYQTTYRAGAEFSHQWLKQLGTRVFGAYSRMEFDDPLASREDDLATLGAGLSWTPLKWMRIGVTYSFTDYRTTAALRNDYQDNRVYFSVSLVPETPIRPDKELSRKTFEDQVFTPENYWKP